MVSNSIPHNKGVYLLVINVDEDIVVKTRRRIFDINRGTYIYVGSARGNGGLRSRLTRYLYKSGKLFWHIDYLLSSNSTKLVEFCFYVTDEDLESFLASILIKMCYPITGFGSSDKKRDPSHLFRCNHLDSVFNKLYRLLPGLKCITI
uniref:DUF123 domain-containing protein n=1 Tax=Staphylothermus marinus TaxID=2280 RepID=A0A7C4HC98_STAMA